MIDKSYKAEKVIECVYSSINMHSIQFVKNVAVKTT